MKIESMEKLVPHIITINEPHEVYNYKTNAYGRNDSLATYRRSAFNVWEKLRAHDWERVYPQSKVDELEELFREEIQKRHVESTA